MRPYVLETKKTLINDDIAGCKTYGAPTRCCNTRSLRKHRKRNRRIFNKISRHHAKNKIRLIIEALNNDSE